VAHAVERVRALVAVGQHGGLARGPVQRGPAGLPLHVGGQGVQATHHGLILQQVAHPLRAGVGKCQAECLGLGHTGFAGLQGGGEGIGHRKSLLCGVRGF